MPNIEMLKNTIKESGMTLTFIANKADMSRQTLYNRLAGKGEFTVTEMSNLSKALGLTSKQKTHIFLE